MSRLFHPPFEIAVHQPRRFAPPMAPGAVFGFAGASRVLPASLFEEAAWIAPRRAFAPLAALAPMAGDRGRSASFTVSFSPTNPIDAGLFYQGAAQTQIGQNLGVQWQRIIVNNITGPTPSDIALATSLRGAGFKIELEISSQQLPPPDPVIYQAQIAAVLDAIAPDLCNINNEVDLSNFYTGTPAQYLAQLELAVEVAHSTGAYAGALGYAANGTRRSYLITNDGPHSFGSAMLYWQYLWNSGQTVAADAFAQVALNGALSGSPQDDDSVYSDLPTTADPTKPVLAHHPILLAALGNMAVLVPGYQATGIDYLNLHMYWWQPDASAQLANFQWIRAQAGNMPLICNEAGQRTTTPGTIPAMMANAVTLGMPLVIWFSFPGARASPLGNLDGSLTEVGGELRDWLRKNGSLSASQILVFTGQGVDPYQNLGLGIGGAQGLGADPSQVLEVQDTASFTGQSAARVV